MPRTMLPNNRPVFCTNPLEVPIIFGQIPQYFRHGISVEAGDVIFDVGANIGLFTLAACDWGRRAVKIFAFEPIPALYESLKANGLHYRVPQLVPLRYGVSRQRGMISFTYYPLSTAMSTVYPYDAQSAVMLQRGFQNLLPQLPPFLRWIGNLPPSLLEVSLKLLVKIVFRGRRVACETVSLSDAIREHGLDRIDLIKIDAEKAELDILEGIDAEDWKKIRKIVIEVHDIGGRLNVVMDMLRTQGFSHLACEQEEDMKDFGVFTIFARRNS